MTRSAFTLIEIIVAGAITAIIAASLFTFIADLQLRQQSLAQELAATRAASSLFDHIEAAARTSVATTPKGRPGFQGQQDQLTITYRAHASSGQPHRTLRIANTRSGIQLRLERQGEAQQEGHSTIAINRVRFDYYDGSDWIPDYSQSAAALPRAVRVKLWFDPPAQDDVAATGVDINQSVSPLGFSGTPPADSDEESQPDRVRVIYIPGPAL